MATYKGSSTEVARSTSKGNAMCLISQVVTVSAALTTSDIVRFGPFPAGIKPSMVTFVHGDLDTGTGALVAKVGYSQVDGGTGDDDLFGASLASFAAVSGAAGTQLIASAPTEIQEDWYLDITPTTGANAMAAAKTIYAIVEGEAIGAK